MKYYVYGCLLLLGIGMSVSADSTQVGAGMRMVGTIGVGDNRGAACVLNQSISKADIFGDRKVVIFSRYSLGKKAWIPTTFEVGEYEGRYFGAKQIKNSQGVSKKVTLTWFLDSQTETYKVIYHEGNLAIDGTVGKYIVCENMVIK